MRVVSHVVITTVAGRESVLWRLHLAGDYGNVEAEGGIVVQLGGRDAVETFDACGGRGCMAEAQPQLSAEIASWLWSGRAIAISFSRPGSGTQLGGILPAHGFRKGLAELIRLRKHEGRTLAAGH